MAEEREQYAESATAAEGVAAKGARALAVEWREAGEGDEWDEEVPELIARSATRAAERIAPATLGQRAVTGLLKAGAVAGAGIAARYAARAPSVAFREAPVLATVAQRAEGWAQRQGAALVVQINAPTRAALRETIRAGMEAGLHPRQIAKQIRPQIGLHRRYADAVERRRASLIEGGMSKARADEVAAKYARRLRTARADTIARTEVSRALHEGRRELYDELSARGAIRGERVLRTWLTAGDERVLDAPCVDMEGVEVVGMDTPFPNGFLDPPVHVLCRCLAVESPL